MSEIYKGVVIDTDLTKKSNGGTEQMRSRLLNNVDPELLKEVSIHFSRPTTIREDVPNVLYLHDLPEDPAVQMLRTDFHKFDCFVFVSYWQRDQYIQRFNLPYSRCVVIQNAIESQFKGYVDKPSDKIRFIYHTTPHRGLEILFPVFSKLCETYDNLHLDVFSSFEVYGWGQRDVPYRPLFNAIESHPNMTYHGAQPNDVVLDALEKSHVFLYPSIWKETSCIALIEAMTKGVLSIYPSYGALPETGSLVSNFGMYEYDEDINRHATQAYHMAAQVIEKQIADPHFIPKAVNSTFRVSPHEINSFRSDWESLLKTIIIGRSNIHGRKE